MLIRFRATLIVLAVFLISSPAMAARYKNAEGMSASDVSDCEAELYMLKGDAFHEAVEECLGALKEAEGDVNAQGRSY